MKLLQYRPHICMALSVLLFASLVLAGGVYVRQKQQWARATLEDVDQRFSRLQGLKLSSAGLVAAQGKLGEAFSKLAYPVSLDVNRAGGDLQERVRKNFEAAGLTVTTSRVLEPKSLKNFDLVSVSLAVTGTLANLQAALVSIRAEGPLLKLDELVIQPVARPMRFDPEYINSTMTVTALRKKT